MWGCRHWSCCYECQKLEYMSRKHSQVDSVAGVGVDIGIVVEMRGASKMISGGGSHVVLHDL